ncbi:MAG TPA: hypothetical protein VFD43_11525 [Planctomycetota bacterium]|nr:hypothetical protein [Planctomycetota bacterium]
MAGTTWTVDANGGGDFTQIAEAVAAVAAGDVLLVEPGTYEGFALTKRLTILGRAGGPRPHVTGDVRLQASTFTLAGFDMDLVHVTDVSGRGRIDDCEIRIADGAVFPAALTVTNCAELVISRTLVVGEYEYVDWGTGGTGITIQSSRVTLVDCQSYGGAGDDEVWGEGGPYAGGAGLRIINGSDVVLAGTSITGGPGGWAFGFYAGAPGGAAVSVADSTVRIRGDSTDGLEGGEPGLSSPYYGAPIEATDSTVVSSGLQYTKGQFWFSNSLFIQPGVAEPFLATSGATTPGATCSIELHGQPGATALLAASLNSSLLALPAFEGQLWFDPSALLVLIPVGTTGQDTPVIISARLPRSLAGLEGTCFELQVFFPTLPGALDPGKKFAGNVAELILRL